MIPAACCPRSGDNGASGTLTTMSAANPETLSTTFTPHPVLGDLLFSTLPDQDTVLECMGTVPDTLGVTVAPVTGKDGILEVTVAKFGATAYLTLIDAPVPDGEAEANAHQLYCQGGERDAVAAHRGQILVAVSPEFTGTDTQEIPARRVQLATARVLGMVVTALTRLPGIVGYYSGPAMATFGPGFLRQVVTGQFGSTPWPLWVSAWLRPGPDGFSGYTCGLWALGHPELQVTDTQRGPEDLFMYLMDTAAYLVVEEEAFSDGQTTGRSAEEQFTLHAEPWVVDPAVPAFRIGL